MFFPFKRCTPKNIVLLLMLVLSSGFHISVQAGFYELPEITETPDFKRKSLLLDLDIPSVRERDPDPQGGPRLSITEFRLQGIVEYPELGITRAEISQIVENIRFDMMGEEKLLESGYTLDELGEMSDLLGDIEDETIGRHVTSLDVQKLVWLVREQRQNRGVTLGMIETIADTITNYYRERGFILAKAYIPQQEVRDGVVTLTLLLGTLGEIAVNNNHLYSDKSLSSVFANTLGKPITSGLIEEGLYLINDFPGITAQGFFEPGSQVGDTKLNINVKSEQRFYGNIRLDNHGSEQSGKNRLYAEGMVNNLLGQSDQLLVGVLLAYNPNNTTYGKLQYTTKIWSPRLLFSIGASSNEFILGSGGSGTSDAIELLEIEGRTKLANANATYIIKRSRKQNYSAELLYEAIRSEIRIGLLPDVGDIGLDDEVRNTSVDFNFDILQEAQKILHQGQVMLTSGEFVFGADPGQDEKYWILSSNYTLLTFWKLPYLEDTTRIIVRTQGQVASSALSSINQFFLAGPTAARGFPISQFSADNGMVVSTDWVFSSPGFLEKIPGSINLKNAMSPFVFADISYGEARSLTKEDDASTATLADVGIGLQFAYSNKIHANLQYAMPVHNSFSSKHLEDGVEENGRLVFDIQYSFR